VSSASVGDDSWDPHRLSRGEWMQHADRPAEVEAFAQPAWHRRARVNVSPCDSLALTEGNPAPREAAASVTMAKSPSQCRRNGPRAGADLHHATVLVVSHHHSARVARQPSTRFRGNVCAILEDRLAWRVDVRQDRRIDVDDDLISVARTTGPYSAVEGGL